MTTRTSDDELLAVHLTRLVDHVLQCVALGLLVGALVTLVIGGFAWQAGSTGWVFAAPGLGVVALAVTVSLRSAPVPWLDA